MAKKLSTDEIQLNITINSNKAKLELGDLDRRAVKLREEMKGLTKGTEEYAAKSRELAQVKARMDELRTQVGLTALSMRQLTQRARELGLIKQHLTPGTAEFKKVDTELQKVNARIKELKTGSQQAGVSLTKMASSFNKYFGIISAGVASIMGSIMGIRKAIQAYSEFDDKIADVMKVTGLTKDQVYAMNEEFKKIDTRTAQDELLDLAWVAGKLGITGQEDIMGFVRAADKINVALKKDLGGSTEEALRQIGKLVDVFKLKDIYGIEEAMLKVGSAINELGMASTANEAFLVEFSKRAAGIAPLAGVSVQNVLGLAATLDQLGQQAESSSTVYTMVMSKMVSKTESFARIAGSSVEDFSNLIRTDANEAFLQLLEGLSGNVDGMEMLVQNLGDISLEGRRSTAVLGVLANNTDTLRKQQQLSNDAFLDGTSLINEFNIKNETAQAILEKKRKVLRNLTIELGQKLMPILTVSTSAFSYFVRAMLAAPRILRENKTEITLLIGALLMLYSTQVKLLALSVLQNITLQGGLALRVKEAIQIRYLIIQEQYRLALIGKTTLATKAAAIASTTWSQALKLLGGPVGLAIGASTVYIALMHKYSRGASEARELEIQKNKALNESKQIYESLSESTEKYRDVQSQLNTLSIERKKNLKEEIEAELDKAYSSLLVVQAKKAEVEADNARLSMWKIMTKSFALMFQGEAEAVKGLQELQEEAQENGKKAASDFEVHIQNIINKIDDFRQSLRIVTNNLESERLGDEMLGETIAQLQEKLNLYRTALNNSAIGSADYIRIQQKLKATQDTLNEAMRNGEEVINEATNAYDELNKKISEAQKHLANYVTLGDLTSAQAWHNILRGLLAQKYVLDQLIAAGGDMTKMLDDFREAQYATGEAIIDSIDADIDKLIANEIKSLSDEAKAATEETAKARLDGYNKEVRQQLELKKAWFDASLDIANTLANATVDIYRNQLQAQTDAQIAALNRRRDVELNNENLTAEEREKINEKYRKQEARIKEAAFRKQKTADIILSIINTGLAVTRALGTAPGWPLNAPMVIAAGIAGAAQTAVIASQKVPQFSKGRYNVIGKDDNKLYKDVPFMGPAKTGIYRNALVGEKGDELIIDNPTLRNIRVNFPEVMQAIHAARVPQYAAGRIPDSSNSQPQDNNKIGLDSEDIKIFSDSVKEFKEVVQDLRASGLEAHLVYQKLKDFERKVEGIESATEI